MSKYRAGDAEIDLAAGTILRAGEEEQIRAQTLRVLRYLIENRDRLVSRDEIIRNVWGDAAVSENVVAQSIRDLRKALGDDSRAPAFISTNPGAGYRFIADLESCPEAPQPTRRYQAWFWVVTVLLCMAGFVVARSVHLPVTAPAPVYLREVGWWRFDEASGDVAEDSSGQGNRGSFFGSVRREPGIMGPALVFDGVRGGAQGVDSALAFPSPHRSRTVSAWFQANSSNGDLAPIFHYGVRNPATGKVEGRVFLTLDLQGRIVQGVGAAGSMVSRHRVDDGRWHQVVAVWKEHKPPDSPRAEAYLYLDGKEEAAGLLPSIDTPAGGQWTIGGFRQGGTSFRGAIDDVRVFNGALSANTAASLYRCSLGARDLEIDGQGYYFLPIFANGFEGMSGRPGTVRNPRPGYGGAQFARPVNGCAIGCVEGSDVGQDVRISMKLTVPTDSDGNISEAGPYFRSRLAAPGDGIVGGESAGYTALLHSTGLLSVLRLNPRLSVAFATIPHFDPSVAHRLEIAAVGERFQASVDGRIIEFDEGGRKTRTVSIPPVWDGPPKVGTNAGAAGVWFGDRNNSGKIGGQTATEIRVEKATSLLDGRLPD